MPCIEVRFGALFLLQTKGQPMSDISVAEKNPRPKIRESRPIAADGVDDEFSIEDAIAAVRPDQIDEITYLPGPNDPSFTVWNGVKFPAHVPVKVKGSQTVEAPLPIRTKVDGKWIDGIMQPDGTLQTRHVARRIPMVVLAKRNPFLSVNGAPPPQRKTGVARLPTDPDQYRGYATRWISEATDAATMDARWAGEQALREQCGCTESDEQWLRPFFDARHEQVKAMG
jgi:hypothetical protein